MTYATLADLTALCGERELIQLTDRAEPPSDQVDEALAEGALTSASQEIDSYVGAKYALPLTVVPQIFKDICCDLARYRLFRDPTDEVAKRRKTAIEHLQMIARGTAVIPGAAGVMPEGQDDVVMIGGGDRLFTRDSLRGF